MDIKEDIVYLLDLNLLVKKRDEKTQRKSYIVTTFFRNYVLKKMTEQNRQDAINLLALFFEC